VKDEGFPLGVNRLWIRRCCDDNIFFACEETWMMTDDGILLLGEYN